MAEAGKSKVERDAQNLRANRSDTTEQRPQISTCDSALAAQLTSSERATSRNSHSLDSRAELEKLREAVNARMSPTHLRRGSPAGSPATPKTSSVRNTTTSNDQFDGSAYSASPSAIDAVFPSPYTTGAQTVSTESTDSAGTIRGSAMPTPSAFPLRTPSYPFPYVPTAGKAFSPAFHEPFTALSPTTPTAVQPSRPSHAPRDRYNSTSSLKFGFGAADMEDHEFPTPDLYDLILRLNCETELEAWWSVLTSIMQQWYKAERVTLSLPADPTDIENVPWGQKAAFRATGLESSHVATHSASPSTSLPSQKSTVTSVSTNLAMTPAHAGRPGLVSRHSYAGHAVRPQPQEQIERPKIPRESTTRPGTSRRMTTQVLPTTELPPKQSNADSRTAKQFLTEQERIATKEFNDSPDEKVTTFVFSLLRALGHDREPLIDSSGVNRVVDRGRLITLTREYPSSANESAGVAPRSTALASKAGKSSPKLDRKKSARKRNHFGSAKTSIGPGLLGNEIAYEEYEQVPASPWSHSPAPSPAMLSEPEKNPFFSPDSQVDEESFNPRQTTEDYSQYRHVEAIGIDNASTIIHLPLIHPLYSRTRQSMHPDASSEAERSDKNSSKPVRSSSLQEFAEVRKEPIAILSILAPAVPYPQNLIESLRMLGPQLAASFHTSYQFTDLMVQLRSSLHRRDLSASLITSGPSSSMGLGIEDLVRFDMDDTNLSISGSINGSSEYSGRSRNSPGGSIVGTPAWDAYASRYASGETPSIVSASDLTESYFDAKKRVGLSRTNSGSGYAHSQTQHATSSRNRSKRTSIPPTTIDESTAPAAKDQKRVKSRDRQTSLVPQAISVPEATHSIEVSTPRGNNSSPRAVTESTDKMNLTLRSYGADFSASFQSLPVTAALRRPAVQDSINQALLGADTPFMLPPSERLLRTMMDALPVQIFLATPETGALEWVNSKLLVFRGRPASEVLENPADGFHPDDREIYEESWQRSLRTGLQMQHKVRLKRFDDQYRWFYVRVLPLRDKRQNIVHWVGTCMDIHEQHVAEQNAAHQQETAASEAKYRAVANSSPQIVFAVTRQRGLTFCNTQWLDYSGQTEEEALGVGFMSCVHQDDLVKCRLPTFDDETQTATNVPISVVPEPSRTMSSSSFGESSSGDSGETNVTLTGYVSPPNLQLPQRKLSDLASTGILKVSKDADGKQAYSTEVRLRAKNGEYRWHLVRVLLAEQILRVDDQEETWYGSCSDINDHKLLERTLKETMDAKSRFLSNMSHEIRTPLNGIHGMVNFLIDSNLTQEQMDQVNVIRASTEGLRDLINDILDLSKVEAGMITLNKDWLRIRSVIEEVNDLTSSLAMDKAIELNYLVEQDVPSLIRGDKFRIRQVLLNVIGNAIKFTREGEVFIRCQLPENAFDDSDGGTVMLRFDVIDTGRGFSETEAELLFKRFSQIDGSSTRQHGGTGLGLVISMQLVELHGGSMSATSTPGKGSTFTFSVKCGLPEKPLDPSQSQIPTLSTLKRTSIAGVPSHMPTLTKQQSVPEPLESPSRSSASSDPSIRTAYTSLRSARSSASSHMSVPPGIIVPSTGSSMKLNFPGDRSFERSRESPLAEETSSLLSPKSLEMHPPMYSILVICPLQWAREATVQHIETTLPRKIPHQIAARQSLADCDDLMGSSDAVLFTHIVVNVKDYETVVKLMDYAFSRDIGPGTSLIVISDATLRRDVTAHASRHNIDQLMRDRRLRFIFKPLKASKVAVIFDPGKEREVSTDHNQNSAQQIADSQKQVFEEMTRRLGNKNLKVLLVEDNRINQMVMLKLLKRVSIDVDTVLDGVECLEMIHTRGHNYYAIVLCDLHMPRKDGYQTCKEIRRWEQEEGYDPVPVVALSANVLGDVSAKCAAAGFNSYLTKPVEFSQLSAVMMEFLDPEQPDQPLRFMQA